MVLCRSGALGMGYGGQKGMPVSLPVNAYLDVFGRSLGFARGLGRLLHELRRANIYLAKRQCLTGCPSLNRGVFLREREIE